tara:strand:- start:796 stop:1026 length:231 start_codon:yes stop_codon:yes gene_type:complete
MSTGFYIGVIAFAVLYFGWMAWEVWRAPVMPDDYGLTDEEKKIWEELDGSKKKTKQTYTIKGKKYKLKERKNEKKV